MFSQGLDDKWKQSHDCLVVGHRQVSRSPSDIDKDMKEAATSSITPMRQCTSDKDLGTSLPFYHETCPPSLPILSESLETFTVRIPVQTVEVPYLAALFPVVVFDVQVEVVSLSFLFDR